MIFPIIFGGMILVVVLCSLGVTIYLRGECAGKGGHDVWPVTWKCANCGKTTREKPHNA